MTNNPFLNALAATSYITLVASIMFFSSSLGLKEPSIIIPITVLSLFVFSAAMMGFIFLYQPLQLLLEGKKQESVNLFLKTVAAFAGITITVLVAWFSLFHPTVYDEKQAAITADYKSAAYMINGARVQLTNGVAETAAAPGSASKVITRYFGDELKTDLNDDGREDIVFLLTQETGGSGTFFYAVAALATPTGYAGSDGYLLGDRIAPQNIVLSENPRHKNVIVVNYADRAPGEPMTTRPSMGKSAYLKLDPASMQWGIVVPNFEGESR